MSMTENMKKKCGYVAILGQPNAGKSTLVNQIIGQKVSIVSPKVQTTRRRILGIHLEGDTQIVLVDTPGLFLPKKSLEKAIVREAFEAPKEADILVYLVDATRKNFHQDLELLKKLPQDIPLYIAFNKVDLVIKETLLLCAEQFSALTYVKGFYMISAEKGKGVQDIVKMLAQNLPDGPWLFEEDQITDMPMKMWASEITREQLYYQLQNELPYETFVETEKYEVFQNGSVKICQAIVVSRDGQKQIILGKNGKRIKSISMRARREIERSIQKPVHLFLFVKVEENWMEKPRFLRELFLVDN